MARFVASLFASKLAPTGGEALYWAAVARLVASLFASKLAPIDGEALHWAALAGLVVSPFAGIAVEWRYWW
ncbi:hypothetical protein GY26_00405 [Gammaproteobacteria bacterium MFB021]|nr:hypothetical protein GY26_00405 [Gammaproteobacteria bacterium MFB021]